MIQLFWLVALSGGAYFLLHKRRFDFLALAFFSACIYFLPGFFGQTREGYAAFGAAKALHPTTYAIFIAVLLTILVTALLWDVAFKQAQSPLRLSDARLMTDILFYIALFALVLTVLSSGSALFAPKKELVLASLTRWHILWEFATGLTVLSAFLHRRYWILAIAVLMVLFDVYIGFRSLFAVTFLALMTALFYQQGPQRLLLRNYHWIGVACGVGFFLFAYKYLYISIKLNDWALVQERLSDWQFVQTIFMGSEPFTLQTVLNEIVSQDYFIGPEHLNDLVYRLGLFMPTLGAEVSSFNDYFQPVLFPGAKGGLANNIWGEMWAVGRWGAISIFLILFTSILMLFNYLMSAKCPALKTLVATLAAYWAFYIHRNDIGFQLDLEKRVLMVWMIAWIGSALWLAARQSKSTTKLSVHQTHKVIET